MIDGRSNNISKEHRKAGQLSPRGESVVESDLLRTICLIGSEEAQTYFSALEREKGRSSSPL